jgi:hypothetical protein
MASRYYSAVAQDTTLTSSITSAATTMYVGSVTGFPTSYPFILAVDYNAGTEELVKVTNVAGLALTISRANAGAGANTVGTPQAHAAGAVVRHVITAQDLTDAQAHYDLGLTGGAHGVTGALSTFLGTPSSANLAGLVSDETGTGPLVFSQSPSLTTPSITGATVTNAVLTGTVTAGGSTGASGQMLTSSGSGVSWTTPVSPNFTVNAQTGTTYTTVLGDASNVVTLNNASPITVTLPAGVYSVGQSLNFVQLGVGQVTFQGDGTSTVKYTPGLKTRAQNSTVSALVIATNTFLLVGDLTA